MSSSPLMTLSCLVLLALAPVCAQQTLKDKEEPAPKLTPEQEKALYEAFMKEQTGKFKYQTGVVKLSAGRANLTLPEGYRFIGRSDAKKLIEDIWGNPPGSGSDVDGVIIPRGEELSDPNAWAIVVHFEEDGYVSDEDANKIDYDDLLKTMKEASAEASKQREAAGYGSMKLVGWALPPRYDHASKVLYWAKQFDIDGAVDSLNYDVRVLGRRGVLSMNAVASVAEAKEIDALTPEITSLVKFNPGHTYAEFDPSTDKKADYTLAGLVLGGAVAAKLLAKGGFLVLLAKFWKLLIIPVIIAFGWLKRKFSGGQAA